MVQTFLAQCQLQRITSVSIKLSDHSLFINCGGHKIESGGKEYEDDLVTEGASYFHPTDRWAYSSTGVFLYNDRSDFVARQTNVTGEKYYQTARLSPTSLKYYGLCLRKGSYKVRLHFAEIQFFDDHTFSSIGNRIFDVSIQVSKRLSIFVVINCTLGIKFSDILLISFASLKAGKSSFLL